MAINNKQKFLQVSKISQSDEYMPICEKEEEGDGYDNRSGLLTHMKPYNLSQEGALNDYKLSIQQQDICHSVVVQLRKRTDLNKLKHFSLELTGLVNKQSTFLILSEVLFKLTNLSSLELIIEDNYIEDISIKQLSLGFQAIKDLRSLKFNMYLCNSSLDNRSLFQEKSPIFNTINPKLSGFLIFYHVLGEFKELQQLELTIGGNNYEKREIIFLSRSISNLSKLTSLTLSINSEVMKSPEPETLITSISKMILLENLKLSLIKCDLTGSNCSSIFLNVQYLVNLQHISLILDSEEIYKRQLLLLTKQFLNFKRLQTIEFVFPGYCFQQESNYEFNQYQQIHQKAKLSWIRHGKKLVNFKMADLGLLDD